MVDRFINEIIDSVKAKEDTTTNLRIISQGNQGE
jgi:hypothetical protein